MIYWVISVITLLFLGFAVMDALQIRAVLSRPMAAAGGAGQIPRSTRWSWRWPAVGLAMLVTGVSAFGRHIPALDQALAQENRNSAIAMADNDAESDSLPAALLPSHEEYGVIGNPPTSARPEPRFVYLGQCASGKWVPRTRKFVELSNMGCADLAVPLGNGLLLTSGHGSKIRAFPSSSRADTVEVGRPIRTLQKVKISKIVRVPIPNTSELDLLWGMLDES